MPEKQNQSYDISTAEILFTPGQEFDLKQIAERHRPWWNRTLCEVSGAWVRIAVMEGDFHWHKHDDTDEFFMVIEGHLDIELEDQMISLDPMQCYTVPKGARHFPQAKGRTVVLMVEKAGLNPTGD